MSTDTINTGIFICTSCGIKECIDTSGLAKIAGESVKFGNCLEVENLCGDSGIEIINQSIGDGELSNILIAACSSRQKTKEFTFDSRIQVERVNLREQVVGTQKANDEDTQMMAEDYLRMGLAKLENSVIPMPFLQEEFSKTVLVVGAGISGLTAALEGAGAGYEVILIEKEEKAGGWLKRFKKQNVNKNDTKKH